MIRVLCLFLIFLFSVNAEATTMQMLKAIAKKKSSGLSSPASFQNGVSPTASYTGCDDIYLDAGLPTTNRAGASLRTKDSTTASFDETWVIRFDVSDIPASAQGNVSSVTLEMTYTSTSASTTLYIYPSLRAWVEDQATWNIYSTGNSWTTAGCKGSGDMTGTFGTATGSVSSYSASGSETTDTKATFSSSASFISLVESALTSDGLVELVCHETANANTANIFYDSEEATASRHPKLTVAWS